MNNSFASHPVLPDRSDERSSQDQTVSDKGVNKAEVENVLAFSHANSESSLIVISKLKNKKGYNYHACCSRPNNNIINNMHVTPHDCYYMTCKVHVNFMQVLLHLFFPLKFIKTVQ